MIGFTLERLHSIFLLHHFRNESAKYTKPNPNLLDTRGLVLEQFIKFYDSQMFVC